METHQWGWGGLAWYLLLPCEGGLMEALQACSSRTEVCVCVCVAGVCPVL